MVTITINTDNEAFDNEPEFEVARILQTVVDRFNSLTAHDGTPLKDINGNVVGRLSINEA